MINLFSFIIYEISEFLKNIIICFQNSVSSSRTDYWRGQIPMNIIHITQTLISSI